MLKLIRSEALSNVYVICLFYHIFGANIQHLTVGNIVPRYWSIVARSVECQEKKFKIQENRGTIEKQHGMILQLRCQTRRINEKLWHSIYTTCPDLTIT